MKKLITIAVAAFNEAPILRDHLEILCNYLKGVEARYDWEIVLVNDGSQDETKSIAETASEVEPRLRVFDHAVNKGLGSALKTAFKESRGEYVVTLDIDLSCKPECIGRLLDKIENTEAAIVTASPSTRGGKMTNVPWVRRFLSRMANRFLAYLVPGKLTNLTCMVRAYNGEFIRSIHLRASGMEIMPEIIYKATIMHEKIDEIPVILNWSVPGRVSKMKVFKHIFATIFTGFTLRPFIFMIFPGLLFMSVAAYTCFWMFIHFFEQYSLIIGESFLDQASDATRAAFKQNPHTFTIGLFTLIIAIQLISSGVRSIQTKHYFEELFDLISRGQK